jgi:hypothetical protein
MPDGPRFHKVSGRGKIRIVKAPQNLRRHHFVHWRGDRITPLSRDSNRDITICEVEIQLKDGTTL